MNDSITSTRPIGEQGIHLTNGPVNETLNRKQKRKNRAANRPQANPDQLIQPPTADKIALFDKALDSDGNEIDIPVTDATRSLIDARTHLAETSTEARKGKTFSNKKNSEQLAAAEDRYIDTVEMFLAEQLDNLDDSISDDDKQSFVADLLAREHGALMGEESNTYVQQYENRSNYDKAIEKYNSLSRSKKIAVGLGAAALTTVAAAGFAAGGLVAGAGAGAVAGARFSRSYLQSEAARRGVAKTDVEVQKQSTLRGSTSADREQVLSNIQSLDDKDPHTLIDTALYNSQAILDRDNDAITAERKTEANDKRKVLGRAALITAGGSLMGALLGAGIGQKLEQTTVWNGLLHGLDVNLSDDDAAEATENDFSSSTETPTNTTQSNLLGSDGQESMPTEQIQELQREKQLLQTEIEQLKDEIEELRTENQELQQELDSSSDTANEDPSMQSAENSEASTPEETAPEIIVSPRSEYLYGEFAGTRMDITIPEHGNIWDQLELAVDQQMPHTTAAEKQRLVGNMLHALEHQYPDRDLSVVYPGENLSFDIPAFA